VKPVDPLDNRGTSRAFYALVSGEDTPKDLAQFLKQAPPSVIEQLHRLQKAGVVELGTKTGKFQHYRVNWKRITEEAVERFPLLSEAVMEDTSAEEDFDKAIAKDRDAPGLKAELAGNTLFQNMIEAYFREKLGLLLEEPVDTPISKAMSDFEDWLFRIFELIRAPPKTDKDLSHLHDLLANWYYWTYVGEEDSPELQAILNTVTSVGFKLTTKAR
jgi:hypothetical protein